MNRAQAGQPPAVKHRTGMEMAKRFGAAIRARREALNLTQADVTLAANVSPMFLSRLERGHGGSELGLAFAVVAVLGLDVALHEKA